MYKGVWAGDNIFPENNILVLGESHYEEEKDKGFESSILTKDVVNNFLEYRNGNRKFAHWMNFFTKVAHCVDDSYNNAQIIGFYEKIYFGNYIDVLCGLKDGFAVDYLFNQANVEKLNDDLFNYVNKNSISDIICVSKLVFCKLPKFRSYENEFLDEENKIVFIKYKANTEYEGCSILLNGDLNLYCIPHPSGFGFVPKYYNPVFMGLSERLGLDK